MSKHINHYLLNKEYTQWQNIYAEITDKKIKISDALKQGFEQLSQLNVDFEQKKMITGHIGILFEDEVKNNAELDKFISPKLGTNNTGIDSLIDKHPHSKLKSYTKPYLEAKPGDQNPIKGVYNMIVDADTQKFLNYLISNDKIGVGINSIVEVLSMPLSVNKYEIKYYDDNPDKTIYCVPNGGRGITFAEMGKEPNLAHKVFRKTKWFAQLVKIYIDAGCPNPITGGNISDLSNPIQSSEALQGFEVAPQFIDVLCSLGFCNDGIDLYTDGKKCARIGSFRSRRKSTYTTYEKLSV